MEDPSWSAQQRTLGNLFSGPDIDPGKRPIVGPAPWDPGSERARKEGARPRLTLGGTLAPAGDRQRRTSLPRREVPRRGSGGAGPPRPASVPLTASRPGPRPSSRRRTPALLPRWRGSRDSEPPPPRCDRGRPRREVVRYHCGSGDPLVRRRRAGSDRALLYHIDTCVAGHTGVTLPRCVRARARRGGEQSLDKVALRF